MILKVEIDLSELVLKIEEIINNNISRIIISTVPNSEDPDSMLITIKQVSDYLRISRGSIYNLIKKGNLESIKIGNKRLFEKKAIDAYISSLTINNMRR